MPRVRDSCGGVRKRRRDRGVEVWRPAKPLDIARENSNLIVDGTLPFFPKTIVSANESGWQKGEGDNWVASKQVYRCTYACKLNRLPSTPLSYHSTHNTWRTILGIRVGSISKQNKGYEAQHPIHHNFCASASFWPLWWTHATNNSNSTKSSNSIDATAVRVRYRRMISFWEATFSLEEIWLFNTTHPQIVLEEAKRATPWTWPIRSNSTSCQARTP